MQVKKEMTCAHSRALLWKGQGLVYQHVKQLRLQQAATSTATSVSRTSA